MKTLLKNTLNKYAINCDNICIENLCKFVDYMKEYNQTHNITAIKEDDEIVYKHLLDSLLPINELQYNKCFNQKDTITHNKTNILDIGCGAGFPSIPLAICDNNLNITAIDSVGKKTNFVNNVKNMLNISNLKVIHTRIEEFAQKSEFREQFDIVTSRAVAPLNIILEYSAPMLKNNGYIFAYKGSNYKEEIEQATNAMKILNCNIEEIYEYSVDEIQAKRYILKIKKNSNISNKYPRKQNKPRLQPL